MKLSGIYVPVPPTCAFEVGDPKRWKSVSSLPHLEISSGNDSLLEQSSLGQRLMGDQADPDADYTAKVLAFDEDDIEDHPFFESLKAPPKDEQWDAETILSTYTTTENHPTSIRMARRPRRG